ncbi:hypothetical protein [Nocardioides sp.]|uniref:hypothetical protein n=1 Tax=Nocardioides sp. TaxID=35761 RepID=UPI002601B74F|nr:hypothetical protein [Nocardioides sp.]MDI6912453.1 hypothetical protein [Nocardioides sp.]
MTTLTAPRTSRATLPSAIALSGIAGAVLFLVGQALLPNLPMTLAKAFPLMVEHRDRLMAARLFTAAGAFLLAPAAVGFARLVPKGARGSQLLRLGAGLFGVATFCNALSQAVAGYATFTVTAPGFDTDAGQIVVDRIESGLVALPLGFWSIPAFAIGCLLMSVALFRSGRVPTWLPVLLAVGTVLAGAFAGLGPIVALTQAPVTVALVAMSLRVANLDEC